MEEREDTISRQAAIDAVHRAVIDFFDFVEDDSESPITHHDEQLLSLNKAITTKIKALPSVERKMGKWYGEADGYADGELVYDMWYCSFCGKRFEEWDEKPNWNYCPNCGAKMEEEHDE